VPKMGYLPPVQWIPGGGGDLSLGVKYPGRKADYSSPSSAEVKIHGAIPLLPIRLFGVVLS
jgi:hypothetical protein